MGGESTSSPAPRVLPGEPGPVWVLGTQPSPPALAAAGLALLTEVPLTAAGSLSPLI